MKITENVERFQYCHFETKFLKKENLFQILEYRFLNENTKIANAMFPYKVPSHKSMFRQIEWVEQTDVPTTQHFIFILSESTGAPLEGFPSL